MDKIEVTNGTVDPDHYGPIGDAARGIASYCDDPQRVHVYTAAFDAIKDIRATRTDATPVAEPRTIYVQWADNGNIRKWAWSEFDLAEKLNVETAPVSDTPFAWAYHYTQKHPGQTKPGAMDIRRDRHHGPIAAGWTEVPLYTHPPATDVAALVENGCEMPEVAAMRYIEELRSDLAASVTILCDNEEAWTKDEQMAVEVVAEWTDWLAKRFMGESVVQCLARAIGSRRQALAPFTKGQP